MVFGIRKPKAPLRYISCSILRSLDILRHIMNSVLSVLILNKGLMEILNSLNSDVISF